MLRPMGGSGFRALGFGGLGVQGFRVSKLAGPSGFRL